MFNKEDNTSSCGNCEYNVKGSTTCRKGCYPKFKYGAHFLCDDFKRLDRSPMSPSQYINNYFRRK